MKRTCAYLVMLLLLAIFGCSSEKRQEQAATPAPPEQVRLLGEADRAKILAFKKELFDIENLSKKAVALVGEEIRLVAKGEKEAVDVAALVEKAKTESMNSLDNLAKRTVPEKLPPWFSQNLEEAKKGFQEGYQAKIESFAAVKRFIDEKSPLALMEYKQKEAEANRLLQDARGRLALVLNAAGLPAEKNGKSGKLNSEQR